MKNHIGIYELSMQEIEVVNGGNPLAIAAAAAALAASLAEAAYKYYEEYGRQKAMEEALKHQNCDSYKMGSGGVEFSGCKR